MNELAISGAFATALMILFSLKFENKVKVVDNTIHVLKMFGIQNLVLDALIKAREMYKDGLDIFEGIIKIGNSGFVVHTVGVSAFSFLKNENYLNSVLPLIKSGGDADTNAAVTGAITGAFYGIDSIPSELIDKLEDGKKILRYANELYEIWNKKEKL